MIPKQSIRMGVAIGSGLLAALLGWLYLHRLETTFQEGGEFISVLVARRFVPRGTPLRASYFQLASVPKAYAQPGTLTSFDVLESSGHPQFRALTPLLAGTQIPQSLLVPLASGEGLSQVIPDNHVAVSFGVDMVHGVGGNLRPGDLINILHTPREGSMGKGNSVTNTLFQAVSVLAVGQKWTSPYQQAANTSAGSLKEAAEAMGDQSVLTVLLNPVAAVRLVQARETETLSVVLRPQGDDRVLENLP